MATISLDLPDDLLVQARRRAAEAGHGDIAEYLRSLIRDDAVQDYGAPEHLTIRDEADLVAKLREGADSPARVLTPADWAQKRRQLIERHRPASQS